MNIETKSQTIQFILEYTVTVDSEEADFMEMTLDEMLAYRVESLDLYADDRMCAIENSQYKGIQYVN